MTWHETMQVFNELYYDLNGPQMGIHEQIEDHPAWKKLEDEMGCEVTMQDVSNWGYLNLK